MNVLKQIGIVFLHWTWGILQTMVGFIGFLIHIKKRHIWINGSIITEVPGYWGGVSIGMFAFVDEMPEGEDAYTYDLVLHEYGHTLQSILLGPLWIFIIGIPSLLWAGCFRKWREKHNVGYYDFYTEKWANKWGGVKSE